MVNLIPVCLATTLTGVSLTALMVGFIGWCSWLRIQERREQGSPERQRERLRREYWRQV